MKANSHLSSISDSAGSSHLSDSLEAENKESLAAVATNLSKEGSRRGNLRSSNDLSEAFDSEVFEFVPRDISSPRRFVTYYIIANILGLETSLLWLFVTLKWRVKTKGNHRAQRRETVKLRKPHEEEEEMLSEGRGVAEEEEEEEARHLLLTRRQHPYQPRLRLRRLTKTQKYKQKQEEVEEVKCREEGAEEGGEDRRS